MREIQKIILVVLVLFVVSTSSVWAQSATESAGASQSAQSSESASATDSGIPTELPQTGAADVFVLTAIGLVFIFAAYASVQVAGEVFSEIQDE